MAQWKPFPIVGGAYSDDAKAWSVQDCCNYIPVIAERPGGRSPSMLLSAPGLLPFSYSAQSAPVRGLHNAEGLLLAVVGDTLYKFAVDGSATVIGTIPGVQRVSMAHNQIAGGNEVAIAAGSSGYVYNTYTDTLTRISDDGFPGSISFAFMDSYILGIDPGRHFAFWSKLADADDYNTLDRVQAEASPDRLMGQTVTHREWWLFGERTIETFINTGANTGTFQRYQGTVIQRGCASGQTICNIAGTVAWLGDDGSVYIADGYAPKRVSTHAIEQDILRSNMADAFAFVFEDRGHEIYYLTLPDGHTWGYDVRSNEWHRRQSYEMDRWRVNDLIRWNGAWMAGDYVNGRLYQLDWNEQAEAGQPMEKRRTPAVLSNNQNRIILNGVQLVVDTGVEQPVKSLIKPLKLSGDLADGSVGDVVDFQYTVTGGIKPVTLSITDGALPDGLAMDDSGHVTGTYTTADAFAWTVTGTDANGNTATLDDVCEVAGIACSAATSYDGGAAYPAIITVGLGPATGDVTLRFTTGPVPDKAEVWLDGVKVIDTGYIGDTSEQSTLDTALAAKGDPSETITQRTGTQASADADWAAGEWDTFTFTKDTAATTATVKVYAPIDTTAWDFALSCPGSAT